MSTTPRLVSLSIDLDAFDLYLGLYGLDASVLSEKAREAVPARAAERFGELCDTLGIKGTLFVVGRDLAAGRGRSELAALHAAGHELASHSFAHDYALSRGSVRAIDDDLARAEEALGTITGTMPAGFRAPGYTLSDTLWERLCARGYQYDSSLLPSPPYYAAKAAVIGALKAFGKESHSILGHVGQLFRPRTPHLHTGLVELPVAVLPGLRIPYIGTLISTVPDAASTLMSRSLAADDHVVIELHGADLCDADDGLPEILLARQRDLRVPAALKRRRIETVMRALLEGREGATLARAASLFRTAAAA